MTRSSPIESNRIESIENSKRLKIVLKKWPNSRVGKIMKGWLEKEPWTIAIVQFRHSLPVLVTLSYIPVVIISTDRRCDLCLPPEGRKKCCATQRRQGSLAFPGKRFPCKRADTGGRTTLEREADRPARDPLLLITYRPSCAELPPSPPIAATSTNCSL